MATRRLGLILPGVSGTSCHWSKKSIVCRASGFHTGRGVFTRDWLRQSVRPATAEPCVPSTWNVTRSSRRTRVTHELLTCATTVPPAPSSSSNVA